MTLSSRPAANALIQARPEYSVTVKGPLAGPARGSFLIDGSLADVGCVRLSVPYQVTSFDLAPGQTYRTQIRTMTDGGSFYPAQIGITATPPQPNAPGVFAPDGCFPKPQSATE